jgi:RHS repeat-associated protein
VGDDGAMTPTSAPPAGRQRGVTVVTRPEARCREHWRRPLQGVRVVGRYYDSAAGQFLSVDPLVQDTQEPYGYANQDPVNESDPTGTMAIPPVDMQYDQEHSCEGQYAHAPGCGQHWYQSKSLPVTVDTGSAALCLFTGVGCIAGAIASTGTQEFHDRVNDCSAGTEVTDGVIGFVGVCLSAISTLGEEALDELRVVKVTYRAHQAAPGALAGGVGTC